MIASCQGTSVCCDSETASPTTLQIACLTSAVAKQPEAGALVYNQSLIASMVVCAFSFMQFVTSYSSLYSFVETAENAGSF